MPLNTAEDAVLVEQKEPLEIDSSTPVDINIKSNETESDPITVEIAKQDFVELKSLLKELIMLQKVNNFYLSQISDTEIRPEELKYDDYY